MIYALLCYMTPQHDEDPSKPLFRMHGETFATRELAEETLHILRRQNLPFRSYIVEIEDPRS